MLPFMEQTSLHEDINFNIPVESPQSVGMRLKKVTYLHCPSDHLAGQYTVFNDINSAMGDAVSNSYTACFGSYDTSKPDPILLGADPDRGNGLFHRNSNIQQSEVLDGLTQTIAIGERAALFAKAPWAGVMTGGTVRTTPGAPVYTAMVEAAPTMAMARAGKWNLNSRYSEPYDFFSVHGGVIFFVFADGSVRPLTSSTERSVFHALATRAGHDVPGVEL
jgi:hypothetical protein